MNPFDTENKANMPGLLLVDDQEDILLFLSSLFGSKYRIFMAYDGKEATELLESQRINLVISDVMMPEMDGFELCDWLKSNDELCHIPIILLTAKDTIQSKIDGLKIGADAYIEKPFSAEHLQAQMENLMRGRSQLKEYYAHSPLAHISQLGFSKGDEQFLADIQGLIMKHLDDPELDVEKLADLLHMSRPTLYRKVKTVFDLSPNEMIHLIRLNKAAELLVKEQLRISEVAEMVGYNSVSQFGRNFFKQFKMKPSEYKEKSKFSY